VDHDADQIQKPFRQGTREALKQPPFEREGKDPEKKKNFNKRPGKKRKGVPMPPPHATLRDKPNVERSGTDLEGSSGDNPFMGGGGGGGGWGGGGGGGGGLSGVRAERNLREREKRDKGDPGTLTVPPLLRPGKEEKRWKKIR